VHFHPLLKDLPLHVWKIEVELLVRSVRIAYANCLDGLGKGTSIDTVLSKISLLLLMRICNVYSTPNGAHNRAGCHLYITCFASQHDNFPPRQEACQGLGIHEFDPSYTQLQPTTPIRNRFARQQPLPPHIPNPPQNKLHPFALPLSLAACFACCACPAALFSFPSSTRRLSIFSSTSSNISLRRIRSRCLRTFGSSRAKRSMSASER